MQKRKNILLVVSLVVMLSLIAFLVWKGNDNRTFEVDAKLFRVNDFKAISKVVLESASSRVELRYNGSSWKLNGDTNTDRNMIDVLFATLEQAAPKRPVASAESDSISRMLDQTGTRVSLFAGDHEEKVFYAGGNSTKTLAYFKLQNDKPYIVTIPGYRVYTAGIFELPANGWKDKFVFGFNWRNFRELEAQFPDDPKKNFKVSMNKDFFGIEGIARIDTAKLNTFLDQVSLLTVDEFRENREMADSLMRLSPVMVVKVRDIAKREYTLSIFKPQGKGGFVPAFVGDSQALFDPRKIAPLLRPRDFFINK